MSGFDPNRRTRLRGGASISRWSLLVGVVCIVIGAAMVIAHKQAASIVIGALLAIIGIGAIASTLRGTPPPGS